MNSDTAKTTAMLMMNRMPMRPVNIIFQQGLLANSPAIVLGNPSQLDKAYVIKAQGNEGKVDWFYMTPKNPDSQFDHIRLGFAGNNLYTMELYDSFGQRTQLVFQNLHYNPGLAADHFSFRIPEGVDVIGEQ